jgi:hydrogenase-4 component B
LVPLPIVSLMGVTLLVLLGLLALWYRRRLAVAPQSETVTWGCGYQRPTARIQYSASSFAAMLVEMFKAVLRPRVHQPGIAAPFPASAAKFHTHVGDLVLDGFLGPMWRRFRSRLVWLRVLQQGSVQTYVLYILLIVSLLLILTMPLSEMVRSLLGGGAP